MTRRRAKLAGIVLLALVALYAAAGFLLSPWLVQRYLPGFLESKLQREVSVGAVRVNPFLLNLEMRDISVEGQHGQPVLAAARVFADLGFMGLFRRTWTVEELRLEGLRVHVVLERDASVNLVELARRFGGGEAQPGRGPPRLVVKQLAVPAARVVFTDLTGQQPASAVLDPVSLAAAGLSTLDNQPATHELSAALPEGGALRWHGELRLYPALAASGEASVRGLAAGTLWPFLRDELQLSGFEGTASGSTRYAYDREQSLRLAGATLDLEDVLLARSGERGPLLQMKKIALAAGRLDLARHAVALGSLELRSGELAVTVAPDGRLDWAGVITPAPAMGSAAGAGGEAAKAATAAARPEGQAPEADDWKLEVAALRTEQVAVRYIDRARQPPLRVALSDLSAQLALSVSGGPAPQVLAQGIAARLQQLAVAPAGAADPAAALRSVRIEQGRFDLQEKFVGARRLSIDGGRTSIVRQRDGDLPLLELIGVAGGDASRTRARQVAAGAPDDNWHYDIEALDIRSVDVALADRTFQPAVAYDLQVRSITATNVADGSQAPTPFEAVVQARQGGTLRASGSVAAGGDSVQAAIELRELATAPLRPVIEDWSGLAVGAGPLSASGHLRYVAAGQGQPQFTLGKLAVSLPDVVLGRPRAAEPAVTLQRLQVHGGSLDLATRSIRAEEIVLSGGGVRVVQTEDGDIAMLEALGLAGPTAPAEVATTAGAGSGDDAPREWRYGVGLLRVEGVRVAWVDRGFEPALSLGGTLQARVKNLGKDRRASFDATLAVNGGGTIRSEGSAALAGPAIQARLEVKDVLLKPLQPLIRRFAAVTVQSGAVSASAALRSGDAGALRASGTFRIADLLLDEAPSGDRLLAWTLLEADQFELDLASRQLVVNEVTVQDPGAKIVISPQRNLNLARLLKPAEEDGGAGQGAAPPAAEGEGETAGAPAGFGFRVARVRLHNGNVDFADLSLVLPFSTRVTQIQGTIVGISNDPSRRAEVKARGAIQPYGSARVEGSLLPAEPERFTNLHVEFDNVLVPPLSPYTATFAGRKVQSGKLWLDLEYRIEDSVLLGDNDIRLSDFTLGERVEAPNAIDVPLNLAVALLTDAEGQIRLSVPVRGNLDRPRFSVASAVKQAIGNALRRIVSAPFRALGRLFGGTAESLAKVEFDAGSAALQPEQREKLDQLGRALAERPRVQLVVTAPYDPQADGRALRRAQARNALAQALGRDLRPGEDPGPIAYDDPATRRALEQLLQRHAGPQALRDLRTQASGRELYEAAFEKIAASQPLRSTAVQVLATERARRIANYLQQQGIAAARVQTGRLAAVDAARDAAVTAQLDLAPAGAGR